ncbi:MAG: hypothetical protein KDJ29_17205 [Hyphomicrobiales bacterium]|nr:hypothetical protein [Hyphomicrobiales bacterium]
MTSLRYSRPKFRVSLVTAAAMTAMVSATVWMMLRAFAVLHATFYAAVSAVVFFAFMSVRMLLGYLRNDVVVAAHPTGLYDARWRAEPVAWEQIREIVARRRENEVELDVYLWRAQSDEAGQAGDGERVPDHVIELAPLEGDINSLIEAMDQHVRLHIEFPAGWRQFGGMAGALR